MTPNLVIAPVLIPFFSALVLLFVRGEDRAIRQRIGVLAVLAQMLVSVLLLRVAAAGAPVVYRLGDWPPPFGIVLVLDRLSALMLLLTAVVALFSLWHSLRGRDTGGRFFHPLFQLQLVGLNGAFLTGDLFNLFVFFEVLLIASYCLLVYGTSPARLKAGIHYVVLNLIGSALFLIAVGILYGVVGTLNMADLAQRIAAAGGVDVALIRVAGYLLLVVFGLKAAVFPLYFWLPNAYSAAVPSVAALFAIMTKVGVYSIVRVQGLIFGADAGFPGGLVAPVLLPAALITTVLGLMGAMASTTLRRMFGYLTVASVGTMLAAFSFFTPGALAGAIYYMMHSALVMAALFMLADLIARRRGDVADRIEAAPSVPRSPLLGGLFFIAAVAVAGLPPLPGFIGKMLILRELPLQASGFWAGGIMLGGGLLYLLALARAGSIVFWKSAAPRSGDGAQPFASSRDMLPAAGLLLCLILLAIFSGPAAEYTRLTAAQLHDAAHAAAVLRGN